MKLKNIVSIILKRTHLPITIKISPYCIDYWKSFSLYYRRELLENYLFIRKSFSTSEKLFIPLIKREILRLMKKEEILRHSSSLNKLTLSDITLTLFPILAKKILSKKYFLFDLNKIFILKKKLPQLSLILTEEKATRVEALNLNFYYPIFYFFILATFKKYEA